LLQRLGVVGIFLILINSLYQKKKKKWHVIPKDRFGAHLPWSLFLIFSKKSNIKVSINSQKKT
jgi:hypothetical protein